MKKVVWFAILFALIMCGSAWAAGKVTVDPNAGVSNTAVEEWDADARLSQKVTYEARHKAVKVILSDLSDMTGITFNAGYNKQDWQVRDRKMNIFAKDITLADLMSSVARVMKFKWSVNKDETPWTYRLYMDRKTLTNANAELSKAEDEFDREVTRRRQNFLDLFENWNDDLSADELDELKNENPYLYHMHTSGIGALMKGVIADIPHFKEIFLGRANDMGPAVSLLSPESQQALLNAAKNSYKVIDSNIPGSGGQFPEDCEKAIASGAMLLDISPDELGWKSIEFSKLAGLGLYINNHFFPIYAHMGDPSDPWVRNFSKIILNALDKNIPSQESFNNDPNRRAVNTDEAKMLEKHFPIEPQPDIPDEPVLHTKIKVIPEHEPNRRPRLADWEAAVAKASEFAVVTDSYKTVWGYAAVGESETELNDVLSAIGEGYRYNWDKHGSVLEMRSKDWFKRRASQIPDEWIEKWTANMKKLGYMSLDDEAQIAALTTSQIEENIGVDDLLSQAGMFSSGSREIWLLRIYASLDVDQKKELFSTIGLSTICFTPDQWKLMRRIYEKYEFDPSVTPTQLKCTRQPNNVYLFELIDTTSNSLLEKWGFRLLEYKEPEKPKTEQKTEEKKSDAASAEPVKK